MIGIYFSSYQSFLLLEKGLSAATIESYQNDLDKFDQIVEGLNSEQELTIAYSKKNKSFVFFQFGRHIMFNEPIVDQHSIRSFAALIQFKKIDIEAFQNRIIQFKDIKNSLLKNVHK